MRSAQRRARKRERPLGTAIAWGVAAMMGVTAASFIILMLVPNSALHNFFVLASQANSATLPLSDLYQQWRESIEREEALIVTPLSMLCGGLTLGLLAPRYAPRRRVLLSGAAMAAILLGVVLAFTWTAALIESGITNRNEGGLIAKKTAPPELIARQAAWDIGFICICALGTGLGLKLRDRRTRVEPEAASPAARSA